MARAFEDSQGRGEAIASAADAALVDLLVDTPTALQLEAEAPQGGPSSTAAAAAQHEAQQLRDIAGTLLERRGDSLLPYAMVAPHVGALIRWLETLDQGNVAVHVQLPPVLTPLREILDMLLRGQPGGGGRMGSTCGRCRCPRKPSHWEHAGTPV